MQALQMQEANARLSEEPKRAELDEQQTSLLAFMQASPMAGLDDELEIDRDLSLTRDAPL